jgi:hypothetical protein
VSDFSIKKDNTIASVDDDGVLQVWTVVINLKSLRMCFDIIDFIDLFQILPRFFCFYNQLMSLLPLEEFPL